MKITALTLSLISSAAAADVTVTFRDGAPVDTFMITPDDTCMTGKVGLTIDLSGSQGGLIFDVTNAGAGVEVFQPLVVIQGQDQIITASDITDGDKTLTLMLSGLSAPIAFTADLDDTAGAREITVSGAEIAGAAVMMSTETTTLNAKFDSSGNATLDTPDCG